jgi:hypothetical protein
MFTQSANDIIGYIHTLTKIPLDLLKRIYI